MSASDVMRRMTKTGGKSRRQVAREIGWSDFFMSSTFAQGVCPHADTLAKVAHAYGYELVAVPANVANKLSTSSDGIIGYDGR